MSQSAFTIREITEKDNPGIARAIRSVFEELFDPIGYSKKGTAYEDVFLDRLYQVYQTPRSVYFVVEKNGEIIGGAGIKQLDATKDNICELQKMYLLPESRGKGIGQLLLKTALAFATLHYRWCYLESLKTMVEAERLYRQAGFTELPLPLVLTAHGACDRWYIVDMHNA